MKTVQDYMNDPWITDDPALKDSLELLKEIHAIRLKVQDENKGLSIGEINHKAKITLASWGISLCRDRTGRGKIGVAAGV